MGRMNKLLMAIVIAGMVLGIVSTTTFSFAGEEKAERGSGTKPRRGIPELKDVVIPELNDEEIFSDPRFGIAKEELYANLDNNLEEKLEKGWGHDNFYISYGKEGTLAMIYTQQDRQHKLSLEEMGRVYERIYFVKKDERERDGILIWLSSFSRKITTGYGYSSRLELIFNDPSFDEENNMWLGTVKVRYVFDNYFLGQQVTLTQDRIYHLEYSKAGYLKPVILLGPAKYSLLFEEGRRRFPRPSGEEISVADFCFIFDSLCWGIKNSKRHSEDFEIRDDEGAHLIFLTGRPELYSEYQRLIIGYVDSNNNGKPDEGENLYCRKGTEIKAREPWEIRVPIAPGSRGEYSFKQGGIGDNFLQ